MNECTAEQRAAHVFASAVDQLIDFPDVEVVRVRKGVAAVILPMRMLAVIRGFKPALAPMSIYMFVASTACPPHPTLIEVNRHFHNLLADGVPMEYKCAKISQAHGRRATDQLLGAH